MLGSLVPADEHGFTLTNDPLFFFIAFIVLSMGLNDNKIAGSYIPKKTVLDDYVNALSTDMKTTFKTIYGSQSGGV